MSINNKNIFRNIFILVSVILPLFSMITATGVAAADPVGPPPSLDVYIQYAESSTPVLVHSYTNSELVALEGGTSQYYKGVDSMPAMRHAKGNGVFISDLIANCRQYNSDVSFSTGYSLKLYAMDTEPNPYRTITYDYLMGTQRCYYPNYTLDDKDLTGAIAIEPMIAVVSYEQRYGTKEQLDAATLDAVYSYRLLFGLTEAEALAGDVAHATTNKWCKWLDRIVIMSPVTSSHSVIIDSSITGGSVTANKTRAAAGETVTLTVSPNNGKQLKNGTLTVSYNNSQTAAITASSNNTYIFTMPAYDVAITAEFENKPCTVTFMSNGAVYSTVNTTYGNSISTPAAPTRTGYTFAGWYYDSGLTNEVIFPYTVMSDVIFYAKWTVSVATTYTINASAGAGGTISPAGSVIVSRGADQIFIITANSGYSIADVKVDNVSCGAITSYIFRNVAAGHSINATFTRLAPTVTSFNPSSGGSGTVVVITGSNLSGATVVTFGGVAAKSFTVDSDTQITAVIGNGASGAVVVTALGGTATSTSKFSFEPYIPVPAITSFNPSSGGSGTVVVITGSNLSGATAVTFGGVAAKSFTVDSDTRITAVVGNGAGGAVAVDTPGGTSTAVINFNFVVATTTAVTPDIITRTLDDTSLIVTTQTSGLTLPTTQGTVSTTGIQDNETTTITVNGSDNNNQKWLPPLIYTGLGVFAVCILAGLYTFRRERVSAYQYEDLASDNSNTGVRTPTAAISPVQLSPKIQDVSFNLDDEDVNVKVEIIVNENSVNPPTKIVIKGNTISVDGQKIQVNVVKNVSNKDLQ